MEQNKVEKIVNGSGFPLQIGIKTLIEKNQENLPWRVLFQEHSWVNYNEDKGGFIDLLLLSKCKVIVLNIECKRVKDVNWLFLQPSTELTSRRHAKAFHTRAENGNIQRMGWIDVATEPTTPESEFCVFGGQDGASRSMLEKLAAEVVESTEGFAIEDHSYSHSTPDFFRYYFNVIVTNAELHVCNFDPESVDISKGTINEATTTSVPFLRFRKQLSIHETPELSWEKVGPREISRAKENTVFVVNSSHILEFLRSFDLDDTYRT